MTFCPAEHRFVTAAVARFVNINDPHDGFVRVCLMPHVLFRANVLFRNEENTGTELCCVTKYPLKKP